MRFWNRMRVDWVAPALTVESIPFVTFVASHFTGCTGIAINLKSQKLSHWLIAVLNFPNSHAEPLVALTAVTSITAHRPSEHYYGVFWRVTGLCASTPRCTTLSPGLCLRQASNFWHPVTGLRALYCTRGLFFLFLPFHVFLILLLLSCSTYCTTDPSATYLLHAPLVLFITWHFLQ